MAYSKTYSRINWENEPSTETPLNENNLNRMDNAVNVLDDRVVELSNHVDNLEEYEPRVSQLAEQARVSASNSATSETNAQAYANQALAHEQQAQIYRNQAEQFKDEAFSGTPEGYEDIVTKVNSLKEHTGTYLAEVGTHEGSVLAKRIYGMSVQDGTPTPDSPVEIESAKADFRCTGKNLIPYPYYGTNATINGITYTINEDGSITANGTATADSNYVLRQGGVSLKSTTNLKIKTNKQLRMSGCPSGGGNSTYNIQLSLTDGSNFWAQTRIDVGNGVTFSYIPSVGYYNICIIRIQIHSGQTVSNLVFHPMLTLADADQTYEVNQHTDITTDLTLRAIEVASTDDYTYERDGKYYIADTVDWSEDRGYEITRRVGEVVYDGTEGWNTSTGSGSRHIFFRNLSDNVPSKTLGDVIYAICNRFSATSRNNFVNNNVTNVFSQNSVNLDVMFVLADTSITTVTQWKTWLESNNVIVDYILATTTTEPITSEQAQALLSLKTYDEATSITATSDIEPTIDIEYATSEMSAKALTGHNEGYIAQELEGVYGVKNLIPYPYYETTKTVNGITFTVNDDGSITVNGTSTQESSLLLVSVNQQLYLEPGTYKVTLPEGTQRQFLRIYDDTNNSRLWDYNSTGNMVVTQRCLFHIALFIRGNETLDNKVFHPMLRPASIQSNEYQPYAMSNYELTKLVKELQTALLEMGGN